MNILLVSNHSVLNAGDYAILLQTLDLLRQAFPHAQVGLVFNDPEPARAFLPNMPIYSAPLAWITRSDATRHIGQQRRAVRWFYVLALLLGVLRYRLHIPTPKLLIDPQKQALFDAFTRADLVLACGGGYLYGPSSQNGRVGWFTYIALPCILALLLGKRLVLLPQSLGPLHDYEQHTIVRWIVRRAAWTWVREACSLRMLQQIGVAERARVMPDLAFGFASAREEEARTLIARTLPSGVSSTVRVGMTALNWHGQNASFSAQAGYEQALLGCIDYITAQGGSVVLFAQTCGPSVGEDDRQVNVRLHGQVRQPERVVMINAILEPALLQAAYGQMDYFIGTRMHSVILALNAGTPALAIGYLHKTQGVLAEIGIAEHCYEISTLTSAQLIAGFERLRAAPPHAAVQRYLAHARAATAALPAQLQAIVRSA